MENFENAGSARTGWWERAVRACAPNPDGGKLARYWAGLGEWEAAIVFLTALGIAVLWIVTSERIHHEFDEAVATSFKETSNLAIALEEHTVRTFKGIDQALSVVAHYRKEGENIDFGKLIKDGTIETGLILNIGVLDE